MLKLSDVVNAFLKLDDNCDIYLNKNNGTFISISNKADGSFYEDRTKNYYTDLANNTDEYIQLPNCKAIGSGKIMKKFIPTIEIKEIQEEFEREVDYKSCSKFMDMIYRFGLVDFWNDFKYKEMIEIAKETINYYKLDCVDDINAKMDFNIEVTLTIKKVFSIKGDSAIDALNKLKDVIDKTSLNEYEIVSEEKVIIK